MPKTWFITGASRGLGTDIARAALAAGHRVVATARDPAAFDRVLDVDPRFLLRLKLDVADPAQASEAVQAAVGHFGSIDVLVNNAGYGHIGPFEETAPEDARAQFDTNLFGVLHLCRAALPAMRAARGGRILNISSIAGLRGSEGGSLYCASKHALNGFSESLAKEVAPFNIRVSVVEPGFFRTEFLGAQSIRFGARPIADYAETSARLRNFFGERHGQQAGDPRKLADVLLTLADDPEPPMHFVAGTDAVAVLSEKLDAMRAELEHWRPLSVSTDL